MAKNTSVPKVAPVRKNPKSFWLEMCRFSSVKTGAKMRERIPKNSMKIRMWVMVVIFLPGC